MYTFSHLLKLLALGVAQNTLGVIGNQQQFVQIADLHDRRLEKQNRMNRDIG